MRQNKCIVIPPFARFLHHHPYIIHKTGHASIASLDSIFTMHKL